MIEKDYAYFHGGQKLLGYLAHTDTAARPAVLVVHDWSGRNEFACQKAKMLAKLGYVGFAVDMFGDGVVGRTTEEKQALIQPLMQDRALLLQRLSSALHTVKQLSMVDASQIAVIGFCFGGLCALDLARSGASIQGVVSFHGLLHPPQQAEFRIISAKILALHGFDDPMVTPEQVIAFSQEMTNAQADWQVHMYGQTKHAFTNPHANDSALGTVYQACADKRAMQSMKNFFSEIFHCV